MFKYSSSNIRKYCDIFISIRYIQFLRENSKLKEKGNIIFLCLIFIFSYYFLQIDLNLWYWDNIFYCTTPVLLPLKTYPDLNLLEDLKKDLNKVGGVYGFINLKDGKQYIGSSSNLYERFRDHVKGVSTNIRLKRSITKHGLDQFSFVIYYYHKDLNVLLTDIETEVIRSFPFEDLYNFKMDANSMLGYKHTADAIAKMKTRLSDKSNHPMYGKNHSLESLKAISKPGKLNPMFNKKHKIESKEKISIALSKTPLGLYDIENKLLRSFNNQVELAAEFNIFKGTIGRYLKSGRLFLGKYYIRKLN